MMRLSSKETVVRDILVLFLLITLVQGGQPGNGEESILLLGNLKVILQPEQSPDWPPASETIPKNTTHAQGHLEATQHLICTRTDIFAVLGSCRDFYYCKDATGQEMEWSAFRFTCPQGRVFDVDSKVCNVPSLVTGRPECQREKTLTEASPGDNEVLETGTDRESFDGIVSDITLKRRERRSAEMQCSNEEVERMINAIDEPCTDFSNIDKYVILIHSLTSSELPSFDEEVYKRIIKSYNRDLEIAQNNANDWRNNNNVFNSIKKTISLAKEFDTKIIRSFKNNLERIDIILDHEGELTTVKKVELMSYSANITKLSEMLSTVQSKRIVTIVENYLKRLKENFRRKEKEYDEVRKKYEIPELINYLEMVRNGASEITIKAVVAERKIENFVTNIGQDLTRFKKYQRVLEEAINKLETNKNENHKEINNIQTQIKELNKRISNGRKSVENTRRMKINAAWKLANLRGIRGKRSPIDPMTIFVGFSTLVGALMVKEILDKDNPAKPDFWALRVNALQKEINNLEYQIRGFLNDITFYNNKLFTIQKKSKDLNNEILQFSQLNRIFQSLQNEVNYIAPSLRNAKDGIMKIKGIFEAIDLKLKELIYQAKETKTELENERYSYFRYQNISGMICIWKKLSVKMTLLGRCFGF